MRSLLCLATLPIIGLAADAFAQKPDRTPVTKAMYMVTGLH